MSELAGGVSAGVAEDVEEDFAVYCEVRFISRADAFFDDGEGGTQICLLGGV